MQAWWVPGPGELLLQGALDRCGTLAVAGIHDRVEGAAVLVA